MVEVYGSGGYPKCRSCKLQIQHADFCLISDLAGYFKNAETKEFVLKAKTLRYCANDSCYTKISDYEKLHSNIQPMDVKNLIKGNIKDEDMDKLQSQFKSIVFAEIWK